MTESMERGRRAHWRTEDQMLRRFRRGESMRDLARELNHDMSHVEECVRRELERRDRKKG